MRWLFLLVPSLAFGQAPSPRIHTNHLNGWYMYFGDHPIKGRWELHLENQWRRHDGILRWQQNLFRPGVNYQLNERVSLTAGYAHIRTHPYGNFPGPYRFDEHRLWQQVILTQKIGRVRFQHRLRPEQRWVESPTADRWVYSNRFRYFGKATIPLKGRWFATLYDEVFINLPPNQPSRKMDQNRAYAALGRRIGRHNSIEAGYLHQLLIRYGGSLYEHNHTLQFGFFSRTPFSR